MLRSLVGSEMCIRDRTSAVATLLLLQCLLTWCALCDQNTKRLCFELTTCSLYCIQIIASCFFATIEKVACPKDLEEDESFIYEINTVSFKLPKVRFDYTYACHPNQLKFCTHALVHDSTPFGVVLFTGSHRHRRLLLTLRFTRSLYLKTHMGFRWFALA